MNYFAHAYLTASNNPAVLMGNMMGDFIKGNNYLQFEPAIQQGIILHRHIDTFTDANNNVREIILLFRPHYHLYSGPLVNVMLDHFLINDTSRFANENAHKTLIQNVYTTIQYYASLMPEKMAHLTHYMIKYDWLTNYKQTHGIANSWQGMSKRLPHLGNVQKAIDIFENEYEHINSIYLKVIQDLEKEFL
jgi:acyl carrier protein phosphodiesterase